MRIVIIVNDKKKGKYIAKKLSVLNVKKCIIFTNMDKAINYSNRRNVDCVVFERSQIESYETFFSLFNNPVQLFVPISETLNNHDVMDVINTHRAAYYLIAPITSEQLDEMLTNIEYWQRMNKSYS